MPNKCLHILAPGSQDELQPEPSELSKKEKNHGSDLKTSCKSFIESLKGTFDYFKNSEYIIEYINDTSDEELGTEIYKMLVPFNNEITNLLNTSNQKNAHFKFLEKIVLFKLLNLRDFKSENKKTKISLVKHLVKLLSVSTNFVNIELLESVGTEITDQLTSLFNESPQLNNLVEKLTNKVKNDNINPMELLGSLVTGNTGGSGSSSIQELMSEIKTDISKINKNDLEGMTKNLCGILGQVDTAKISKSLPDLNGLNSLNGINGNDMQKMFEMFQGGMGGLGKGI